MNELLSMVVPLDTLAGWPEATSPTALQMLGLLVGLPVLVFVIVVGWAKVSNLIQAKRGEDVAGTDPVWLGGPNQPAPADIGEQTAAIDAGPADGGGSHAVEGDGADAGGASARW